MRATIASFESRRGCYLKKCRFQPFRGDSRCQSRPPVRVVRFKSASQRRLQMACEFGHAGEALSAREAGSGDGDEPIAEMALQYQFEIV